MSDWFILRHTGRLAAASAFAMIACATVPAQAQGPLAPTPIIDISQQLSDTARIGERFLFDEPRPALDDVDGTAPVAALTMRGEGIDPLAVKTVAFSAEPGGAAPARVHVPARRDAECGGLGGCEYRELPLTDIVVCIILLGLFSLREGPFDITLGMPHWVRRSHLPEMV